jgi:transcriptional regulator with XRE-family HTH domain
MININKAVSLTIIELRKKAQLSQEELAHQAEIHRTYVSQIERGLKSPTLQVLIKIASALDVKPSEIMRHIEKELNDLQSK